MIVRREKHMLKVGDKVYFKLGVQDLCDIAEFDGDRICTITQIVQYQRKDYTSYQGSYWEEMYHIQNSAGNLFIINREDICPLIELFRMFVDVQK